MQNKLNKQADLSDSLQNIAAIATCLQAIIQTDKLQEFNKSSQFNQSKSKSNTANINALTISKTENNSGDFTKQTQDQNQESVKSIKKQNTAKSKIHCYKCDKKDHMKRNCSDKLK